MTRARDVANLIGSGNFSSTTFTATAGQTAFTISHTQGFIQVFMNGLLLDETVDYTSNGSAVTLTSGAAAGDEIEVVAYNTFSVGNAITQTAADTRYVNATGDTMTGALTVNRANSGTNLNLVVPSDQRFNQVDFKNGTTQKGAIWTDEQTDLMGYYTPSGWGMNFYTGGSERMKIDSSGRVTMPNQPAFDVSQPLQSSGDHTWNNTHLNRGSHYNSSNGRFTAPVAGVYIFFHGGIKGGNSTTAARLYLKKNGTRLYSQRHLRLDGSTNQYGENGSVQWIVELAVNDYIQAETGAGTAYTSTAEYNVFGGYLIG